MGDNNHNNPDLHAAAKPHIDKANEVTSSLSVGFETGLFDQVCDPMACLCVLCCPFCPIAVAKANLDNRDVTLLDFCCITNPYQIRQTLRAKYSMGYSGITDCVTYLCCTPCAICQDVVEVSKKTGKPLQYFSDFKEI